MTLMLTVLQMWLRISKVDLFRRLPYFDRSDTVDSVPLEFCTGSEHFGNQ